RRRPPLVGFGAALEARVGLGRGDQLDDRLVAGEWAAPPVHGDVAEQPVLDLVPLGGAGREVAHRHLKAGLGRKPGQLSLPGADPIAVGPARIGTDPKYVRLEAQSTTG